MSITGIGVVGFNIMIKSHIVERLRSSSFNKHLIPLSFIRGCNPFFILSITSFFAKNEIYALKYIEVSAYSPLVL